MAFNALQLQEDMSLAINPITEDDLPAGEVLVKVDYSTLNYKDGLIMNGLVKLVKQYPHVPGIDFSGTVEASEDERYKPGDRVVLNGWRVGEIHWGGYAQKARVKADWLVPLPDEISTKRAMAIGTAGYTAMLSVMALEEHGLTPYQDGEVLVTGASGGVGSIACAILARLGYQVAGSTGSEDSHNYLLELGVSTIVPRAELEEGPRGPLGAERWIGAIDNVGGTTLHHVLATLKYWSCCASVGLAASNELNTTVLPFLMRGITLQGIDSATCPYERRVKAYQRLVTELPEDVLDSMTSTICLSDLPEVGKKILKGQTQGRIIVDVNS
ncbi:putative oxidoreductase, Zn-dependent and NAD(P)-binding [Candidatus Terasakiella magnetica]|uniref:Putative oxidoreductase, Zn-dependent and NAD(P)-binding n=1 Tax=Candidatus Terasakiella magnetica TaxID=1867952 RepID=A0A1C3RKL8_9PROT|nr:MDR family oxidoreductase [Candidatus Terasakiella magnetica]SCA57796.1 putative oxidoreductase, Zn-dependent and NAD(P)-binding [Candidatus Terasakiella magnetica]